MRLFFAVWPPDEVRLRLWDSLAPWRERLPSVRWVPPERLHITLRFMGDFSAHRVPRLVSAAEELGRVDPFEVALSGTGAFPRRGPPRVYWVGVRGKPLPGLRERLDRALSREGMAPENRTFRPHLTVGRANRGRAGGYRAPRTELVALPELAFTVGAVHVVRSDPLPGGPRYTNLHRAVLAPGTDPSRVHRPSNAVGTSPRAAKGE